METQLEKQRTTHLEKQLENVDRLIWDSYIPDSLKEATRGKKGKGMRRKVSDQAKLTGHWMDFQRDSANKKELFAFLTSKVADHRCPQGKAVYITSGQLCPSFL